MFIGITALACLAFCIPADCGADDGIPEAQLERLKNATVFVKSGFKRGKGTGSGFVLKNDGKAVYVVTNSHTVAYGDQESKDIRLAFFSGTADEKVVSATIVGRDEQRDLAILKAALDKPPLPIDTAEPKLRETMSVYILGFPFGEQLAERSGRPAVTVGRGTISSLRKDEFQNLESVQIDGDVNPGNSGGPIVDSGGKLVGITVAKVSGTQIGLVIPGRQLADMLRGGIATAQFNEKQRDAQTATFDVNVTLIDPMRGMKAVAILAIDKEACKAQPQRDAQGRWKELETGMSRQMLTLGDGHATGQMKLKADPRRRTTYLVQVKYRTADGTIAWTEPQSLMIGLQLRDRTAGKGKKKEDDDWITEEKSDTEPDGEANEPLVIRRFIKGEPIKLEGAVAVPLQLNGENVLPSLQWYSDGDYVHVLEKDGLLRQISTMDLMLERQIDLGHECHGLVTSRSGLVVTVRVLEELWLVNFRDLEVKQRIPVPGLMAATSSMMMDEAIAVCRDPNNPRGTRYAFVDLRQGKVKEVIDGRALAPDKSAIVRHKSSPPLTLVQILRVTPDGKYLFLASNDSLHRVRIEGNRLIHEESAPHGGSNALRIEISDDSKYVALICGSGNAEASGHPGTGPYNTYLYRVDNLQRPATWIKQGAYPQALALNREAKRIYSQNRDYHLMTYQLDGAEDLKLKLPLEGNDRTRHLLVHPRGKKIFVLTDKGLYLMRLN